MKKLASLGIVIALSAAVLASCGSEPFTCDLCSEEKTGKKHTTDLYGTEITICDDCNKGLEELAEGLNDLGNILG